MTESLSIVVPIHNEEENIRLLYQELTETLVPMGCEYEILLVDDGSTDGSREILTELARHDVRVKVIQFRRNYGQTAAMRAGIEYATGDVVVTLDGDLQNDPRDIPKMVDALGDDFDLIHGWRKDRQDKLLTRKIPSWIANWLISRVTRFPIHDLGCTLKVIRRDIAQEIELYGEMHRFIPILAHWRGARCQEVVTHHRARIHGTTKYGLSRTFRVVLDLMTVSFMLRYSASPMKLFGMFGIFSLTSGVAFAGVTGAMKLFSGVDMTGNPLLLLSMLFTLVSMQFFSIGLLGEVSARTYFNTHQQSPYAIRTTRNLQSGSTLRRAA